ncbi:septum site-determining protein Ssd [Kocuria sp. M1R5S2]|uniref:septum site-determining protein Ssd n=1 Tax=Kocuria rhizosphaerae TaxID=3376285 RepID=UPI0037A2C166
MSAAAPVPAPPRRSRTSPPPARTVRLVGDDPELRRTVERICVSAGVRLLEGPGPRPAADTDLVDVRHAVRGRLRPGTVLLGRPEDTQLWDRAAALGGCPVAVLPEAAGWLADLLGADRGGTARSEGRGRVLGLLGAVGGAGTSTLACWTADLAARSGRAVALVDADRAGCGLDVLLGLEDRDGLRWPDLLRIAGAVHAEQLWPAMARTGRLRWLSWDRSLPAPLEVPYPPVLEALRGAAQLVVVDLGRAGPECAEAAALCDEVIVVSPRTVRGVLAARWAAGVLEGVPARLVLAGLNVADVDDALAAATTGLPVAGSVRFRGRVPEAAETGRLLEAGRARRTARDVARLLAAVGVGP